MWRQGLTLLLSCWLLPCQVLAAEGHAGHEGHQMQFDATGMVMNSNSETLPRGCNAISEDVHLTVHAGTAYAQAFPDRTFAYSQHDFQVPPCSRVMVHFINEDEVRHQWMLHGLPRYLYPQGMFHLEAAGGQTVMGSFIVPPDDATYLVHCDITQHMEKGMKAQLRVGKGDGQLWSIPGVTRNFRGSDGDNGAIGMTLVMASVPVLTLLLLLIINLRKVRVSDRVPDSRQSIPD